jgi:hypothetical protein
VDANRNWTCSRVPAAEFDLTILTRGFAPEYRWAVLVPPGGNLDLGPLALRQGASIAGWVQISPGSALDPNCIVRLSPAEVTDNSPVLTAKVQGQGFFQLTGVAPGTYVLEADQSGYRSPKVPVTVVFPDSATYLKGVVLQRAP